MELYLKPTANQTTANSNSTHYYASLCSVCSEKGSADARTETALPYLTSPEL